MALLSVEEIVPNNKVESDNHDTEMKNLEELNSISLYFLLNWSPKDYYLNFDELKASEGYKPMTEIDLSDPQKSNISHVKEQLQVRDNIILKFYQYFEKVFSISKQSQIKLNELNKKKKTLLKIIRRLKLGKTPKKLVKKETVSCEEKTVETKKEESNVDWNSYSQHCSNFFVGENNSENAAEKNIESDSIMVPSSESLGDNTLQDAGAIPDQNIIDVDTSKYICYPENEDSNEKNATDVTDFNWSKVDVKEQVTELATEITEKLGYVFVKDLDMYYDHSSGYYYDHKTSLYYDAKTGTYFYFNYETNKYEFHSQVNPATPEAGTKEKEEGEFSDSNEAVEKESKEDIEIAPSLRLMVMNGNDKGSLHLVTVDGGKLGREGNLQVLLKNPSISKVHAEITYKSDRPDDHHYYIQDLGSHNGTFIKGQRLSESRKQSHTVEIGHGWEIKVGDVILCCHIHPRLLTCNECEPGLIILSSDDDDDDNDDEFDVLAGPGKLSKREVKTSELLPVEDPNGRLETLPVEDPKGRLETLPVEASKERLETPVVEASKERLHTSFVEKRNARLEKIFEQDRIRNRENERRRQNRMIRKKFSISYFESAPTIEKSKYKDRAGKRRVEVGSDNPYEKTEIASIDTNLTRVNKGFQLMEKMGWAEGQSLGKSDTGLTEPVVPVTSVGRMGLGCQAYPMANVLPVSSSRKTRLRILQNSKMIESSSESSENSGENKGIRPIKFTPSVSSNVT